MDPQLARVVGRLPVLDLSDLEVIRALNEATVLPVSESDRDVEVVEEHVAGPPGAPLVRVRLYRPRAARGALPLVVYLHPGLVFGTLEMDHARCMRYTSGAGCVVASVDYRLAPEHPYPAGVEDCYARVASLVAGAGRFDIDPERVGIAGCSTGATLAAAVALMARDRGGPALALQLLLQPALDDRLDTASMAEFHEPDHCEAGRVGSAHTWRHYLGENPADVPAYAAPARADDLSGLPPAYVSTAERDCLRDEGIAYATRLIAAGVPTELHHWPGTFHAFDLVVRTAAISQQAVSEQIRVLRHALGTRRRR